MRLRTLLLISIICVLGTMPVTAYFEVIQGSTVYRGEIVDISRVVGWEGKFAYWSSGEPSQAQPNIIIDASTFQHKYYIDPNLYCVGTWYKYDNDYERAGNMLAFYVKDGIRPSPTPEPAPVQVQIPDLFNVSVIPPTISKTNITIARGEELKYSYLMGADKGDAWFWFFDQSTNYMGMPMFHNGTDYWYPFVSSITQEMSPGTYQGYMQFAGYNNKQDVFYSSGNTLDSIYKNVKPVNLNDLTRTQYRTEFYRMANDSRYSDDLLIPITLTVKEPSIRIQEYYEAGDAIIVEGTTTLSPDTKITCIIDSTHWATSKEKAQNTYPVIVTGDIDTDRHFSVEMPLRWDELGIGEHVIEMSVDDNGIELKQNKEFWITNTYVMPTPTPETVKVITSEFGSHRITPKETQPPIIVVTTTPAPLSTQPPMYYNYTPSTNFTTSETPLVNITKTTTPTKTPKPLPTVYTVPLNPVVGLLALVSVASYVLWKRR